MTITKDECKQLAQLLIKLHNSTTTNHASLYGEKTDKALCRDLFTVLFYYGDYETLRKLELGFNHQPV